MELVAALPDSNCASRLGHRPSQNAIPNPHTSRYCPAPRASQRGGRRGRLRVSPENRRRTDRPAESVPQSLPGHTPDGTSALEPELSSPPPASSALLRRTEDQKDQAISTTPTRPVMISLIWYWMVTSRMTDSAPIA